MNPIHRRYATWNHEAAHAVAAYLLGVPVSRIAVHSAAGPGRLGETVVETAGATPLDLAVVRLAAVLTFPTPGSDQDVEEVAVLARIAGRDPDDFEAEASRRARDLVSTPVFGRAVDALSACFLDAPVVAGDDLEGILRDL